VYSVPPRGAIWIVPPGGDPKPHLLATVGRPDAKISPDGKWLAYASDESGPSDRPEVYVQSMSTPGTKWRISTMGGSFPRWRSDGKELFYLGGDNSVMAIRIDVNATILRPGIPEPLFDTRLNTMPEGLRSFGVSPNGQRFLIAMANDGVPTQSLVVVSNWQSGLKP
jgi:dipeptidyl aminopeptidase/acylaminoacyl peptidase